MHFVQQGFFFPSLRRLAIALSISLSLHLFLLVDFPSSARTYLDAGAIVVQLNSGAERREKSIPVNAGTPTSRRPSQSPPKRVLPNTFGPAAAHPGTADRQSGLSRRSAAQESVSGQLPSRDVVVEYLLAIAERFRAKETNGPDQMGELVVDLTILFELGVPKIVDVTGLESEPLIQFRQRLLAAIVATPAPAEISAARRIHLDIKARLNVPQATDSGAKSRS